jgi:DNA-binding GntR family transcriptional regulator
MSQVRGVDVVTAVDAVTADLNERIFQGDIAPGTRLVGAALADEYGVSRQTIREALANLARRGVLESRPRRGMVVTLLEPASIRDLFHARRALEVAAVRTLARTGSVGPGVGQAVDRLAGLRAGDPWIEVVDADVAFHEALMASVGSPRMTRLFSTLTDEARLCIAQAMRPRYSSVEALVDEHRAVVDAIEAGDVAAAAGAMTEHLRAGLEHILSPDPITTQGHDV